MSVENHNDKTCKKRSLACVQYAFVWRRNFPAMGGTIGNGELIVLLIRCCLCNL